jgi:hypothetical protein
MLPAVALLVAFAPDVTMAAHWLPIGTAAGGRVALFVDPARIMTVGRYRKGWFKYRIEQLSALPAGAAAARDPRRVKNTLITLTCSTPTARVERPVLSRSTFMGQMTLRWVSSRVYRWRRPSSQSRHRIPWASGFSTLFAGRNARASCGSVLRSPQVSPPPPPTCAKFPSQHRRG